MAKMDDILNHIIDIKKSQGAIEEHLKNLNSKVATNQTHIERNRQSVIKINLRLALASGVVLAASTAINLFF